MRSDEFIDLYKQLEDELEVKFSTAKQRRYSSVVFEYINHYESAPVRETLNLCREIRNLMTHSDKRQQHSLCKAFFARFKFDGKHGQERLFAHSGYRKREISRCIQRVHDFFVHFA